MNYYEIRQKELEITKDYSEEKFKRYIKFNKVFKALNSEIFMWSVSTIPFIVAIFFIKDFYLFFLFCHFLFWKIKGKKVYHRDCDKEVEELELTIEVLNDIYKEKFDKK